MRRRRFFSRRRGRSLTERRAGCLRASGRPPGRRDIARGSKGSKPTVTVLNRDIVAIIVADDMKERLQALGTDAIGSTPEHVSERSKVEMET